MNLCHRFICKSAFWKRRLERDVVPWVLDGVALGDEVLEIGPGPGLTTDLLRGRAARLTALEVDRGFADSLAKRLLGTNVTVIARDATAMGFSDECFSAAICMTMLHHVPSTGLQDRIFDEVARVLCPGAVFVGCDRIFHSRWDPTHWFDTKVPVPPDSLYQRLWRAGFEKIKVETRRHDFRFMAWKPARAGGPEGEVR